MSTSVLAAIVSLQCLAAAPAAKFERDTIKTSRGDLEITFIAHGTLMFRFDGMVVHVDPVGSYADYSRLPKADVILVTHEHGDHLDPAAIEKITTQDTALVLTAVCARKLGRGLVMKNGDIKTVKGLKIEAVPAYNVVHLRGPGQPFHPKGVGNGYVITFGDKRVYLAGDTEDIPEMTKLTGIDVAFLPMNLPYTMTPEMVAKAARAFMPKIVYPYHYGKTNPAELVDLLKNDRGIEVRIRRMQ
ncbi:MAG: MBL fold metallo-hydrolase [Pirellulales bacterium]|nr:MBL fold metallo-hydrolase [Pirellulales bacterium]